MTRKYVMKKTRRSAYNPELAEHIASLVAAGLEWKVICERVGKTFMTINRWRREHNDFDVKLSRAREQSAYVTEQHIRVLERRLVQPRFIATGEVDDKGKAIKAENPEWIDTGAASVVIRSMQWRMAHANFAAYGDRREVNLQGTIEHRPVAELAPAWVREAIAAAPNVTTIDGEATEVDEDGAETA